MNKTFGKLFKIVNEPWQIYPVGILFGLGFDTATQIALIAISIGVSGSVPFMVRPYDAASVYCRDGYN